MKMTPRDVAAYCQIINKNGEWERIPFTRIIFDSHGGMWQSCPPSASGAEAFGPKGSARKILSEEDIERCYLEEPRGAGTEEEFYYMGVCLGVDFFS
jgi:hypothetical protein